MKKKAKILTFLLLILLALILYLILTSASVKKIDNSSLPTSPTGRQAEQAGQPVKNKITVLSEADYKIKVKEIFTAYEKLASDHNLTTAKVEELKNQLLSLKGFQAKFQKLHLTFVQAMDKAEDYLSSQAERGKNTSQQMIDQLKADYGWLNN